MFTSVGHGETNNLVHPLRYFLKEKKRKNIISKLNMLKRLSFTYTESKKPFFGQFKSITFICKFSVKRITVRYAYL